VLELRPEDKAELEQIVARGSVWRQRERAQTILYFGAGWSAKAIASQQKLNLDTVYDRRTDWLTGGFSSLVDKHRCGAPSKVSEVQREQLRLWATQEAMTSRQLVTKLHEEFEVSIHPNTLSAILKQMKFVWKRTRHSLKKKRDEVLFKQAQTEIEALKVAADKAEIVVAYCDEAGFSPTHPNRSAWTPVGKCHTSDALRGKRLNVVGALLSTGELFCAKLWQTMTAQLFIGYLGLLQNHVGKPLVVILDNASIHKAKAIQDALAFLEKKGLKLYFLPPYSPELNRIENVWHKMKYEWMAYKARDAQTLEADVDDVLDGFGKKYTFSFF
jgi:transposase